MYRECLGNVVGSRAARYSREQAGNQPEFVICSISYTDGQVLDDLPVFVANIGATELWRMPSKSDAVANLHTESAICAASDLRCSRLNVGSGISVPEWYCEQSQAEGLTSLDSRVPCGVWTSPS